MNALRHRAAHAGCARGAALILVLWLLVLLTAVVGGFAQSARIESLQAHQLRASLVARQAARAGIEYATLRMLYPDTQRRWVPDGRKYGLKLGDAQLEIHVVDESGKVDLNTASPDLLAKLLLALGVRQPRAQNLAAAIVDYRDPDDLLTPGGAESGDYSSAGLPYGPKNKPFEAVSELQRVLGMDFALYQKLVPNVTVYSGGDPTPTTWSRSAAPSPRITPPRGFPTGRRTSRSKPCLNCSACSAWISRCTRNLCPT